MSPDWCPLKCTKFNFFSIPLLLLLLYLCLVLMFAFYLFVWLALFINYFIQCVGCVCVYLPLLWPALNVQLTRITGSNFDAHTRKSGRKNALRRCCVYFSANFIQSSHDNVLEWSEEFPLSKWIETKWIWLALSSMRVCIAIYAIFCFCQECNIQQVQYKMQ